MRSSLWLFAVTVLSLLAACNETVEVRESVFTDFNGLVQGVSQALALRDVDRLLAQTERVRVVCDERLVQEATPCRDRPVGREVEGFDVKFFGRQIALLDGQELRLLLEGMLQGADPQAPADQFGGPGLQLYSTLLPDPLVWFPDDDPAHLPQRGDIAITYIGRSPQEDDRVHRRLWTAVAEQGADGVWKIRLWLVGFFRPDHPALNPSEQNGFQRWSPQ